MRLATSIPPSLSFFAKALQQFTVAAMPARPALATAGPGTAQQARAVRPARLTAEAAPAPRPLPDGCEDGGHGAAVPWQTHLPFGADQTPEGRRRGVRVRRAPAEAGRIVISGRMDEVCAELDRLVACEALSH